MSARTLGACAPSNTGPRADTLLALTAVLASGEVVRLGRPVVKASSGYSLMHLVIGSEGTLAVITELTMKLIPKPQADMTFILPFEDIEHAIGAVPKIKLAGLAPQSLEFMERDIVDSSAAPTRAMPSSRPTCRATKSAPTSS